MQAIFQKHSVGENKSANVLTCAWREDVRALN